jgi:hypothetical protein
MWSTDPKSRQYWFQNPIIIHRALSDDSQNRRGTGQTQWAMDSRRQPSISPGGNPLEGGVRGRPLAWLLSPMQHYTLQPQTPLFPKR